MEIERWLWPWFRNAAIAHNKIVSKTGTGIMHRIPTFPDSVPDEHIPVDYQRVTGKEMREYLEMVPVFAFDFETTDPHFNRAFSARRAVPIGFSASRKAGEARYTSDDVSCIRDLLAYYGVLKIAHNAQFESVVCANAGITLRNVDCTQTMAFVLRKPQTGLKDLTRAEFGIDQTRFAEVDWTDDAAVTLYGCADSDMTYRLYARMTKELIHRGLWKFYEQFERTLPSILGRMHMRGMPLDSGVLAELEKHLTDLLATTDVQLAGLYPYPGINWESTDQRRRVLYGPNQWQARVLRELKGRLKHDELCNRLVRVNVCTCHGSVKEGAQSILEWIPPGLSLPPQIVEGSDTPSTGIRALRMLRDGLAVTDDVAGIALTEVLELRASVQQALRLNVRGLPLHVQEDGRIHSTFIQAGAFEEHGAEGNDAPETGRIASRGPNVQNITHHGDTERPYIVEWANVIRRAFYAPAGWTWVKVDVGREEPWIGYVVSGDEKWGRDLREGDIYKTAAAFAYQVPFEEVTGEQRQIGKRMAMAWLNRARAYGIRKSATWLSPDAAETWCRQMDENYPRITTWHRDELVPSLYEHGYVKTWFGRLCPLTKIWLGPSLAQQSRGRYKTREQRAAERECVPMVIQGTGGDILKLAIQRVEAAINPEWAYMTAPVHDELNLLVRDERVDYVCRDVLSHMLDDILPVPLLVEITCGPTWAEQTAWLDTSPKICYSGDV